MRDATVALFKLKPLHEKWVDMNGARRSGATFPGHDLEAINTSNNMRVSLRTMVVHNRLYRLLYLRYSEKAEPFQQLLSTFELE